MTVFSWIAEPDNQTTLHRLSKQAVEQIAPEELPFFEELFPRYVQVAQESEVTTAKQDKAAFQFAGEGELLSLVILPALVAILTALLVKRGAGRLSELQDADRGQNGPSLSARDQIQTEIERVLLANISSRSLREQLSDSLSTILTNYLMHR